MSCGIKDTHESSLIWRIHGLQMKGRFMDMLFNNKSLSQTTQLALLALFITLRTLAGLFRITLAPSLVLSFSFLFIMTEVLIFDWKWVIISAALGDILNYLMFPGSYGFSIQYTFLAVIQTLCYWFWLHGKRITVVRLAACKLFNNVFCNILLNSLLMHFLFNAPLEAALLIRIPKNLILWPIETAVAFIGLRFIKRILVSKQLVDESLLPFTFK